MVRITQTLCRYIPEWYHIQKSSSNFFKKQSYFYMTRFYKNIGWSTFKSARLTYEYLLKGESFYSKQRSLVRRDTNRARIAAACEEHGYEYKKLMSTLPKVDINLSLAALARLAIYEPKTFRAIVDISKAVTDENLKPVNFNPNRLDSNQDVPRNIVLTT